MLFSHHEFLKAHAGDNFRSAGSGDPYGRKDYRDYVALAFPDNREFNNNRVISWVTAPELAIAELLISIVCS